MTLIIGYLLFSYSVWIGYKALKAQVMDPRKIFILPLLFIIWSVWAMVVGFGGAIDLFIWLVFLVMGYAVGWGVSQPWQIRADRQKMRIGLPGSWATLLYVLVPFGVKFFFGYFQKGDPKIVHLLNLISVSIATGALVGQTLAIAKKFAKAKHEKLRKK